MLNYIFYNMNIAWRIMNGDDVAYQGFDRSKYGFAFSFIAYVLCLPLFYIDGQMEMALLQTFGVEEKSDNYYGLRFLFVICETCLFIAFMALISKLWNKLHDLPALIIAQNWALPYILLLVIIPKTIVWFGLMDQEAYAIAFFGMLGIYIYTRYQIATKAYRADIFQALQIILFDLALGLLLSGFVFSK